jgi:penicillin-binding protein 1A
MGGINKDLPSKDWDKPLEGVIEATVCSTSGQILTENCGDHKTTQWFLEGTVPTELCSVHSNTTNSAIAIARLEKEMYQSGQRRTVTYDTTPLVLNLDFLKDGYDFEDEESQFDYGDDDNDNHSGPHNTSYEDIDYNYLME